MCDRIPNPQKRLMIVCVALMMMLIVSTTTAEDRNGGEFRGGLGAAPVQTLFELFTDITMATLSFGTIEPSTETENAALFVEYVKPMGDKSRLITHFNYTSYEKHYVIRSSGQTAGNVTDDFYTFMLGVKHYYVKTSSFGLYIDIMGGVSILRSTTDIDELETDNAYLIAYQVTPLGLRIGGAAAVDLAVGLGYKGIVTLGVGYEF